MRRRVLVVVAICGCGGGGGGGGTGGGTVQLPDLTQLTDLFKRGSAPPAAVQPSAPKAPRGLWASPANVFPPRGTVTGGTHVAIIVQEIEVGAKVTFCGQPPLSTLVGQRSLTAVTAPHAAALCDIQITNPDGESVTVPGAYTFTE